uniref:Uncharacterized protein n=1 Tax=Solanum tuberosum TaxID=4113 RepID=M1BZ81_SOLTU
MLDDSSSQRWIKQQQLSTVPAVRFQQPSTRFRPWGLRDGDTLRPKDDESIPGVRLALSSSGRG